MVFLIATVCIAVLITHWPVLSAKAQFIDDDQYITGNVLVQNPGWVSAKRFLTEVLEPSTVQGYYQPLTMISLMLDSAIGDSEKNLLIFHRTSLLIHIANIALIMILLYLLFDNIWIAAGVGLLFGLHPMTVETITWLGERKTLLAAFFSFWSLIFYVNFTHTNNKKYYAVCFLAYLLALMSKPTSLFLPIVMLLMDYWPLKRFNRQTVFEKLPLFIFAIVFAVIFVISQKLTAGMSIPGEYEHRLQNIPLIICHNIIFYPAKMLWPVNLSSHYVYPEPFTFSNPLLVACVIASIILIFLVVISVRRIPALFTGWLIFFITILPTMQVLKFSDVIASDKFTYLPSMGLLMLLTFFLIWIYRGRIIRAIIITAIVLLLTGSEAVATRRYLVYWQDSITLYKYMLSLAPKSVPLYGNFAIIYSKLGQNQEAVELLQRAVSLRPNDALAYYNLGFVYGQLGRYREQIEACDQAIKIQPDYAEAYNILGTAYGKLNRYTEAVEAFKQAIKLKPEYTATYYNLGAAYDKLGRYQEAIESFKQAIRFNPNYAEVYNSIGIAYGRLGRYTEEVEACKQATRIRPDYAEAYYNLGNTYGKTGSYQNAVEAYKSAIRAKPDYAMAHNNLGNTLSLLGLYQEAIEAYKQVIQFKPDYSGAYYNLGTVYLLVGDKDSALKEYEILKKLDAEKANKLFNLIYK